MSKHNRSLRAAQAHKANKPGAHRFKPRNNLPPTAERGYPQAFKDWLAAQLANPPDKRLRAFLQAAWDECAAADWQPLALDSERGRPNRSLPPAKAHQGLADYLLSEGYTRKPDTAPDAEPGSFIWTRE